MLSGNKNNTIGNWMNRNIKYVFILPSVFFRDYYDHLPFGIQFDNEL